MAETLIPPQPNKIGLSDLEAAKRLSEYGPNEIEGQSVHSWQILFRQFNTPFIWLLLSAAILSFVMGQITDGAMVLVFIFINALLGFTQEYHSQKSLELLKKYVVAEARVRRGNVEKLIPTRLLVPGDVVIVEAGDIIPADMAFFEATSLLANESILTGESAPVEKIASVVVRTSRDLSLPEKNQQGFSGTTVVSGKGVGIVVATGQATTLGDIARLTIKTRHVSAFEKNISKFSKFILRMILIVLVLLFGINLIIKSGHANIFELALFSIALAVSVVPEALPVVTTIALSKGSAKLAKHHVVVKRLSAVEDLGSIEILCTDKTGTLTENKLTVAAVNAADAAQCLFLGALATPFLGQRTREPNNAFDIALFEKLSAAEQKQFTNYSKIAEIPFDPERRRNSVLIERSNGTGHGTATPSALPLSKGEKIDALNRTLIVRGAPEVLFELCALPKSDRAKLEKWMAAEGALGRRVIALGTKPFSGGNNYEPADEHGLAWQGIMSFVDPIKSTARQALDKARQLGLRIKILTGDSKEVAAAVGAAVGLVTTDADVTVGDEVMKITDLASQVALVEKASVFARLSPTQKYRIIELLQTKYEVGFLGEGINDAPALKMADVGIVVKDASDIARDAADIVLLKKSLNVIVDGIHDGREIFANTVKYIKATLISNFGNFFAIAVASLLLDYLPMLPVQILLLNLLSDFPMVAIATDNVDADELRRPRAYNVKEIVLIALAFGVVSTVFDFIFFAVFRPLGAATLQTNWFIGSVLTELVLIFSIRTNRFFLLGKRPGLILALLSVAAFGAAMALPFMPFTRQLFSFIRPDPGQLALLLGIVALYFVMNEALKMLYYRRTKTLNA